MVVWIGVFVGSTIVGVGYLWLLPALRPLSYYWVAEANCKGRFVPNLFVAF